MQRSDPLRTRRGPRAEIAHDRLPEAVRRSPHTIAHGTAGQGLAGRWPIAADKIRAARGRVVQAATLAGTTRWYLLARLA
ncbi:hypothetical protein GCM10020219_041820 [Nonomuraea dietziae]